MVLVAQLYLLILLILFDLLTNMGVDYNTMPESYLGFSRITIHSQYDLENLMTQVFNNVETETRISWAFRNNKLVFFTDDIVATDIFVDFGSSFCCYKFYTNSMVKKHILLG